MMSDMWQDHERYQSYFRFKGWFLTGDIVIRDDDGYYYHQGRNDDLIKIGGDRVIGPFEIELVLCGHPAVNEAAVIAKGAEPGEGISYLKAFITVNPNYTPSIRLNHEINAAEGRNCKINNKNKMLIKQKLVCATFSGFLYGLGCIFVYQQFENFGDTWYGLLYSASLILRWNWALRVNTIQFC